MDTQIQSLYKLFPTNYIAADMLNGNTDFSHNYTADEKEQFARHLRDMEEKLKNDKIELLPFLLNIYANPVFNQYQAGVKANR
jgi:hypothetical protein